MLDGASAADRKVLAKRRDPLRAGVLDGEQAAAVRMMAWNILHLDGFAAERVGHINALAAGQGDTLAVLADMIDDEAFNHGARR